jgi:hypothetical protein
MTRNFGRLVPALAAAAAVAAVAAAASAGPTAVTFTTPKSGSNISLKSNPYLAVAGGVTFAPATAQTTRFYLRRDGCGTSNDNPHLSTQNGNDAGDGCGLIINAVVGVGGDADPAAFVDFPASDGMPLALDTGRQITGTIDVNGNAAGAVIVDVGMEGLANGQGVTIGSDSVTFVLDPTVSDNAIPFTIQPDATLAGADLQGVDLRIHIHGPAVDAGFMGLSGKSFVDVPSYAASVNRSVKLSLDASFANAVQAGLDASGSTWSIAIPTPAIGKHTLYAQSSQGFATSATASTTFTVKR